MATHAVYALFEMYTYDMHDARHEAPLMLPRCRMLPTSSGQGSGVRASRPGGADAGAVTACRASQLTHPRDSAWRIQATSMAYGQGGRRDAERKSSRGQTGWKGSLELLMGKVPPVVKGAVYGNCQ
ncbi:hypothetical protein CKAH01_09932 [Colletotrichum kahawae]|uniref:Uncharacterized protein n=1 Tax=Colletotrichum kahawae TaxID=34407 RepID=A0AAE0CZS1_COLKA|nr:hypothetical protein CKAH01_09932 [Colletotrichum kahawae]